MNLGLRATLGLLVVLAVLGAVLFAAGGFSWPSVAYLCVFGGASALITLDLMRRDNALLQRRVTAGPLAEPTITQKIIQTFAGIGFLAIFALSARTRVDHLWMTILGLLLVALGFWIVFRVFRENTYTAGTIGVADDQHVIDTGPYAIVRHPMYVGALAVFIGTPIALGSWWGLTIVPAMIVVLVLRLTDEERQLATDLPGYDRYRAHVRWRLIPGIF